METTKNLSARGERFREFSHLSLLYIEDDQDDIYLFNKRFKSKFVSVQAVGSLVEAKRFFDSESADVVLLDLGLESSKGLDTLEAFLALKIKKPLVVLTGDSDPETNARALELGAQDYIFKNEMDYAGLERRLHNAIFRFQRENEYKELAHTDELLDIPNRRALFEFIDNQIALANEEESAFAVAMLDIDDFKVINDSYGHEVGDFVLYNFSRSVVRVIRRSDYFARLGGDEFVIVFPEYSSLDELTDVLERVLESISVPFSQVDGAEQRIHKITSSIGIAEWSSLFSSAEDVLKLADEALYESKEEGKNRLKFH